MFRKYIGLKLFFSIKLLKTKDREKNIKYIYVLNFSSSTESLSREGETRNSIENATAIFLLF